MKKFWFSCFIFILVVVSVSLIRPFTRRKLGFRGFIVPIIGLGIMLISCTPEKKSESIDLVQYVDPMIGTDAHGHTFPGATYPFGMLQLSPSNDFKNWDWCSGYHYSDSVLKGFAHNHISGPGLSGLGDILLMPTSEIQLLPGTEQNPEQGYRSRFSHDNEEATPGYYSVFLDDENVEVELTTTSRVGFHRYTFREAGQKYVTIDPTHSIAEFAYETGINILSDTEVTGYKKSKSGTAGDRTVYFYAIFSKPFNQSGVGIKEEVQADLTELKGRGVRGFAGFEMEAGESLNVEVALSYVSQEGAKLNWESEGKEHDFESALEDTQNEWNNVLNKIVISTPKESDKRVFYTSMYHSFISPNLISDVNGEYFVEGEIRKSDIPQYSNFSTWDTYRALHPLHTILEQEKTGEVISSMVSRHSEAGLVLPGWEAIGYDNVCMIGYNMTSPIADAVLKDIDGIDQEAAYEAIKAAAFDLTKNSPNYDKNGMESYIKYGFVTGETGSSVSKTTEQNYYDWAIARVAEKLGKKDEAKMFDQRSKSWRNQFDPASGYLYPKLSSGESVEMDTTTWNGLRSNYVSGNIWAYSAYTPHDMKAAIQLQGGRAAYVDWLDGIFTNNHAMDGHQHVDISGFIGKYGHGDEPGHQMPYQFTVAGAPWKTQQYVNKVITEMYNDQPDGLINNEDLGQMSAWYIFSTLGFYPLAPGDLAYQFGAPYFDEAVINLENGNQFKVIANNQSEQNIYVQSAILNGKPHDKSFITHEQIMSGGVLEFEMGAEPNQDWGAAPENSFLGAFDDQAKAEIKQLASYAPYDISNDNFFVETHEIKLASDDPGVKIYYTLDGSKPDQSSRLYSGSIEIADDALLNAIAVSEGLSPSVVYTKPYFKSILAGLSDGFPKITVEDIKTPYGLSDCSMIFDQKIGSETYSDGRWTGLKEDFNILLDLGEKKKISQMIIGALTDTGVWIFPPDKIEVHAGNTENSLSKIAEMEISELTGDEKRVVRYELEGDGNSYQYVKFYIKNYGRAPEWHGAGRGAVMWLFVDEIILK